MTFLATLFLQALEGCIVVGSFSLLYIQKLCEHQPPVNTSPLKVDTQRDTRNGSFSDRNRLDRIVFDTFVSSLASMFTLVITTRSIEYPEENKHQLIYTITSSAITFATWLYAFIIALTCLRFPLPAKFGWILNIHLFMLSLTLFLTSASLLTIALWNNPNVPFGQYLPSFMSIIFALDLTYTTGTTKRGSPFIDENGKKVVSLTVESILGVLFFNWMSPLVAVAASKDRELTENDLPNIPSKHRAHNLFYIFNDTGGENILYRLFSANKSTVMLQVFLSTTASFLCFASPFFLNKLLQLIQDYTTAKSNDAPIMIGTCYLLAMIGSAVILRLFEAHLSFQERSNLEIKITAMLRMELYRKTLHGADLSILSGKKCDSSTSKFEINSNNSDNDEDEDEDESGELSSGTIYNLMSRDAGDISSVSSIWCLILRTSIELIIGICFLYKLLGWSSILGLVFMVIAVPLNKFCTSLLRRTMGKFREAQDKRVSLMNEALQGIRQIKFFAWESKWIKRIMKSRQEELEILKQQWVVQLVTAILWKGPPLLVTVISFCSYTKLQGHELNAAVAFTSITVFRELSGSISSIPELFVQWHMTSISLKRIENYLNRDESKQPFYVPSAGDTSRATPDVKIGAENATVSWSVPGSTLELSRNSDKASVIEPLVSTDAVTEDAPFSLKDLNVIFPNNKLSLICGATGSGKTLLMLSLLGETITLKGSVFCPRFAPSLNMNSSAALVSISVDQDASEVPENWILNHAVAYVAQTAWLQHASIRDNILFGLPYAHNRYKATLAACALENDLSYWKSGDLTEIGEKGITLSGGQKARVALARAVYSRAQNILIDDVLSAVDTHTAKHLYKHCLMGPLMLNRTRILITHNVNLCIQGSDHIVFIDGGQIRLSGSPTELRQRNQLSQIFDESVSIDEDIEDKKDKKSDNKDAVLAENAAGQIYQQQTENPSALIEEEFRATGTVKLELYQFYARCMGNWYYWFILSAIIFSTRVLDIGSSWWLKIWTKSYEDLSRGNTSTINELFIGNASTMLTQISSYISPAMLKNKQTGYSLNYYLGIYITIEVSRILVFLVRLNLDFLGSLTASKKIYWNLLDRIFHAPLRYFDTTPVGRIMKRISGDFQIVDESTPREFTGFCVEWSMFVGTVIAVTLALPSLIIPMVFITGALYIFCNSQFFHASRELNRIDSVNCSPLFTMFGESIAGVTTIRAFGMTQQFMLNMFTKIDGSSRPAYYYNGCGKWIDARSAVLNTSVTLAAGGIILFNLDKIDASTAGFCLNFILSFTSMSLSAFRRYNTLETSFNAVERLVELLEVDQEAPSITDVRPPQNWPSQGAVEVKNLHVKYAPELDDILKGLTFSVNPHEKIGIVGRTGSGKSTLALCFYRFIEATEGSIVIDGVNIADIGTEDLRSNLTIIPQDPVLFSGTLRYNMDPFNQFTDSEIFEAFQRVQLLVVYTDDEDSAIFPSTLISKKDSYEQFTNEEIHAIFERICFFKESLEENNKVKGSVPSSNTVRFELDSFDQFTAKEISTSLRIIFFLRNSFEGGTNTQALWCSIASRIEPLCFFGTTDIAGSSIDQFTSEEILTAYRIAKLLYKPSEEEVFKSFRMLWFSNRRCDQNMFNDLNTRVREDGSNFSKGQQQLLCLARALLHHSKIIIMDEATASIDFKTEEAIKETIATEFATSTVLCIAHRISSVIEYDRILVLEEGNILEFANPLELIRDQNSAFYHLCRKSGDFENLLELAKAKHELIDATEQ